MTNEEIRKSNPIDKYTLKENGSRTDYYFKTDTEKIVNDYSEIVMNLARKDERNKVIEEIEEWTKEKLFEVSVGRNLNLKVLSLSNIIDKLNSLKNP